MPHFLRFMAKNDVKRLVGSKISYGPSYDPFKEVWIIRYDSYRLPHWHKLSELFNYVAQKHQLLA